MTTQPIVPCLWFDDQAEQAARFYTETFSDGRVNAVSHYPQAIDNSGGKPRGSVLTVEFALAEQRFTALNGGPIFTMNPSISFFAYVDSPVEADRLFAALADCGKVLMPIDTYPWSERYGWVEDRFGVSWQVITLRRTPGDARIVPCLMFAGAVHGKAEEAMRAYASIFPGGRVELLERYAAAEGPVGAVKHGRFVVNGQTLIAMDSHLDHGFTFNEAISFQVMCNNQTVLDRYWYALSEGGEKGRCGWLTDRFGISWQVVPIGITEWMTSKDSAARDRAFEAMLQMGKLDISALKAAFHGTG